MMETKINSKRMEKIQKLYGYGCGIDVCFDGSHRGLVLACRENIFVELRSFFYHHIDVLVTNEGWARR